jgi:hypothetical protein
VVYAIPEVFLTTHLEKSGTAGRDLSTRRTSCPGLGRGVRKKFTISQSLCIIMRKNVVKLSFDLLCGKRKGERYPDCKHTHHMIQPGDDIYYVLVKDKNCQPKKSYQTKNFSNALE